MLPDETCWFVAIDFDKSSWRDDVLAFWDACDEMGIPVAVERSRSGDGAHAWVFFACPIRASQARKLACAALTRAMEHRHQMGLDSYDRLFPNQDTMPRGGFGNLIALPLQRGPRDRGNSLFVGRDLGPHADQWAFLASVRRMLPEEVERIVLRASETGSIVGVRPSLSDDDHGTEDPWTLPPSGKRTEKVVQEPLPDRVRVVLGNMAYVEKAGLPPTMLNRLVRLAAFQNPEFYRAQAMRMSTFGKPRIIACAEEFARHIALPRGCLAEVVELLEANGVEVEVVDERHRGTPIEAAFRGTLTPPQDDALRALLACDIGVLSAATAFGKTVVAIRLIAERKVNTLVLVHRRQLMDQWRERLETFLETAPGTVGTVGGGRSAPSGLVDIGIMQSLCRKGEVRDLVAGYGQVIVDECHHVPAFSFERVLKQVKARYVVGLTATPVRRDGHHPIVVMQCGPIRFRCSRTNEAAGEPFEHVVIRRDTGFKLPSQTADPGIQEIYRALAKDVSRNEMILADVVTAVRSGRSPLLLTERTGHRDDLAQALLRRGIRNVIVLRGGASAKAREAAASQLAAIPDGEERVLVATGRYIGEGFGDARLDTLFLAMPISWRGTLQQYAGRLHRVHHGKREVQVYDYVDVRVPVLVKMYGRRLKGYEAMGYRVHGPSGLESLDELASPRARRPRGAVAR